MSKITIDSLISSLEVFLRENPSWQDAEVVVVANCLIARKGAELVSLDLEKDFQDLVKKSS